MEKNELIKTLKEIQSRCDVEHLTEETLCEQYFEAFEAIAQFTTDKEVKNAIINFIYR